MQPLFTRTLSPRPSISKKEFNLFKQLISDEFGIALSENKSALVQSRLAKWIIKLNYSNYTELYQHFCADSSELILLADAITTQIDKFSFFFESMNNTFLGYKRFDNAECWNNKNILFTFH